MTELGEIADQIAMLRREGLNVGDVSLYLDESLALNRIADSLERHNKLMEESNLYRAQSVPPLVPPRRRLDWTLCALFAAVWGLGILLGVMIGG